VHGNTFYEIWELKWYVWHGYYVGNNNCFDHIKLIKKIDFIDINILVNVTFEYCDN
jgi:hypothetical protein